MTADCRFCRKIIVKPGGIIENGCWYCSTQCLEKDPNSQTEPYISDLLPEDGFGVSADDPADPEAEDHSHVEDADLNFDELLN